jgi:hypothetical protein
MRAVNLLPRDATEGRKRPPMPVLAGCVGTVLVTALLAVLFLSASSSVAQQRRALLDAQAQFAAIPAPPAPSTRSFRSSVRHGSPHSRPPSASALRGTACCVRSRRWFRATSGSSP